MNKNDFIIPEGSTFYEAKFNEIEIWISDNQMSDKTLLLAERILKTYPKKYSDIVEYLFEDDRIGVFFNNPSKEEIAKKLHEPVIMIDEHGGVLSYFNHELDYVHSIDIEFYGAFEQFFCISING